MKLPLSQLGQELEQSLQGRDVIVFDGVCVLCSRFFHFMHSQDRHGRFHYAVGQSPLGQACYGALGLSQENFETVLVIRDGWIHTDLDAVAAAMGALGWPWKALTVLRWLPTFIKRPLYRLVAVNRYRLFGRLDTCMIPNATVQSRFLPGGIG